MVRRELSKRSAESYCQERYANLASIHGYDEQRAVVAGCKLADLSHTWQLEGSGMSGTWFSGKTNEDGTPQQVEGRANGCWIGMHDGQAEGSFAWMDGSNVDFVAWAPFQPDRAGWEEDAVSVTFVDSSTSRGGAWNDHAYATQYTICGECRNGRLGPLTVAAALTRPFLRTETSVPEDDRQSQTWREMNLDTTVDSLSGRFKAVPVAHGWSEGRAFCQSNYFVRRNDLC